MAEELLFPKYLARHLPSKSFYHCVNVNIMVGFADQDQLIVSQSQRHELRLSCHEKGCDALHYAWPARVHDIVDDDGASRVGHRLGKLIIVDDVFGLVSAIDAEELKPAELFDYVELIGDSQIERIRTHIDEFSVGDTIFGHIRSERRQQVFVAPAGIVNVEKLFVEQIYGQARPPIDRVRESY